MDAIRTRDRHLGLAACACAMFAVCLGVFCFCLSPTASAKPYSKELRIDMPNGVKYATTTFSCDLNHDGKADAVKVVPVMKGTASGSHGIRVYVKGNRALALSASTGSARFSLYYVHMSKKLEFLAIAQPRGKKDAFTPGKLMLYRYEKKKLVEVSDLSQKWGKVGLPAHSAVKSAGKSGITVTASFEKSPLGARSYPLFYAYDASEKAFSLATTSAKPVVAPGHWTASVTKTLRKSPAGKRIQIARTVTVDPVPGSGNEATTETTIRTVKNKKVATMKKGAKVTNVRVHENGYVKVTLMNGKSGWFKWAGYKKGKPFKEVGAGY